MRKGNQKMKKIAIKEFSDWTVEEMVEYVLTGKKPMKRKMEKKKKKNEKNEEI